MSTFDTLPGESNAHVISSIINLVCPQCGGPMSEFQCEGRCRRNWLADGNGQITRREALSPVSRATALVRCGDLAPDHEPLADSPTLLGSISAFGCLLYVPRTDRSSA